MNKHYIFKISDYLDSKNIELDNSIIDAIKSRENGKIFSFQDHLRALILSLLSSQREWNKIYHNLDEIKSIFFDYDPDIIINHDSRYFVGELKKRTCGNLSISKQMKGLNKTIEIMKKIVATHGSLDNFITMLPARAIASLLSDKHSPYKLPNVGFALACEYLRNVGLNIAKPDEHLNRFLGNARMGTSHNKISSINETLDQIETISKETGLYTAKIDSIIWHYCANKFGNICNENPKCQECIISNLCNRNKEEK